jgi:microcystin-dependent protein
MKFTLYRKSGKRKIGNQPELTSGTIVAFVSATAPGGWIACRGQTLNSVSDPTYANLYSAIGTTYGGSSASSFALPDLRLRVPIGAGTGAGLSARTRGNSLGSNTHSLSSTQTGLRGHPHTKSEVAHGHSIATDSHSHGVGWAVASTNGGGTGGTWWPVDYGTGGATTQGSQNTTAGFSVGTSGHNGYGGTATFSVGHHTGSNGTAHNNMQPSLLINYIIKI